jgi:protein arginine kinase
MRDPGPLDGRGISWLTGGGREAEIVLSTRVRLARNLQGYPFPIRADVEDSARVFERTTAAIEAAESLAGASIWDVDDLEPGERDLLLERHLISRELLERAASGPSRAALVLTPDDGLGIMVNEEDHLRLQAFGAGFALEETWRRVDRLDEELGALIPYAFHHELGFLTSCPTNVGTGLRASVLVHLPGLVLTKEINKVLEGISQVGLTYRGFHGEGSEVEGNLFQLSNQTTLGKTEEDLVEHLERVTGKVIEYERSARSVLLREAPTVLEDKVWRAYGILRSARSLSTGEMLNLLSGLRLGVSLKLLPTPRVDTLNEILVLGQTAHRSRDAGSTLEEPDADAARAAYVRQRLAEDESTSTGEAAPDRDSN